MVRERGLIVGAIDCSVRIRQGSPSGPDVFGGFASVPGLEHKLDTPLGTIRFAEGRRDVPPYDPWGWAQLEEFNSPFISVSPNIGQSAQSIDPGRQYWLIYETP